MRQAGRYLPEYRAIRAKVSFLELCKTPELACEVTLQPIDLVGVDAAILFCDILVVLEAMGMALEFPSGPPVLPEPVRNHADISRLGDPDPEETLGYVMDAIRLIRRELSGRVPLIGFAGAPFTLATYAVEGGGSKSYPHTKGLLYGDPAAAHALLARISAAVSRYLEAQIAAGAQAVQIFDSWAGVLAPPAFREFALRYAREVITSLKASAAYAAAGGVPIIYFVNGCAPYLEDLRDAGADVLGIDFRIDLGEARRRLGEDVAVQGNLDPACLFLPPDRLRDQVAEILASAGPAPGHIFNLGHGILPMTDPDRARAMVAAVKELSAKTP